MMIEALIVGAAATLLLLAAYAAWLWYGVAKIRRERAAKIDSTRETAISSIRALAKEMCEGRLNLTEGAIRIKVMLDYIYPCGSDLPAQFQIFYDVHDKTEHMPRRLARQDISRTELSKLDKERRGLEFKHGDELLKAAEEARVYAF